MINRKEKKKKEKEKKNADRYWYNDHPPEVCHLHSTCLKVDTRELKKGRIFIAQLKLVVVG